MWHMPMPTPVKHSDSKDSVNDMLESMLRRTIVIVLGGMLTWFAIVGMVWPRLISPQVWLILALVGGLGWACYQLIGRRLMLAQVLWQVGLMIVVTLVVLLFDQPELILLYVLLPLTAVLTIGAGAGICVGATVIVLLSWLEGSVTLGLSPALTLTVGVVAVLCGMIGWAFSNILSTVTHWSLAGYEQANRHMREAQNHRAELAQTLKALDHAYYRLERANSALVAARKQAEEAERFKSEFVANVSHELRTPLNLIIGFSEVMITSPESYGNISLPRAYRSDLNAIYQSSQHLLSLVDDVLDLARIDAGRVTLTREDVDLVILIAEVTETVRDYIAKKYLELRVEIEPGLPNVRVDRLRIRQVLLNLLVNAARFTQHGSITVGVSSQAAAALPLSEHTVIESEEPVVVFHVTDTGCGIPAQDLPKVFEEFRSTEQPTSTWHSGTGLGLPISKKFVELHGGHMGVESVAGCGTTFWFTLPISIGPDAAHIGTKPHRWIPHVSLGAPDGIIVVVHEDERVCTLMQRQIEDFQIVSAPNSESGSALAAELNAVALLLDSTQPIPNCREDILVMQCPLPSSQQVALVLGAVDYLIKPVSSQVLLAAVDRVGITPDSILIVDDDPEVARLFSRMLCTRVSSHGCLVAYNGMEALSLMHEKHPSLVLLDLMMPGIDGRTVLEQKAADPEIAAIPTIIVSAENPDTSQLPVMGAVVLTRKNGLVQNEVLRALAGVCSTLAPGWQQISNSA